MIDLRKISKELEDLYTITGEDWHLHISHILTEPVCPTASISPERWQISRYRVDCDHIEESLAKAVALIKSEIIDRKVVGSYAPFTNPDDDAFAKWLYDRANGSDAKLPDVPNRNLPEEFEWILDGWLATHEEHIPKLERGRGFAIGYISARISRYLRPCRLDYEAARKMIESKLPS